MRSSPLNLAIGLVMLIPFSSMAAAADKTGEQIYKQQCARCHGANGEGTKKYPQPLTGDQSVARLSQVIAKTMPENDPGSCVGADADNVARYIHDTFYSPLAQARNNPPQISFSHLTVRQYRNSIADIIGSFRGGAKLDERRGLHGEYFNARFFQNNKKLIDRVDGQVQFDFGISGPVADKEKDKVKFDPHQFCIRWEGSVLAPESGAYEFIVRTEHATKLWVNDNRKPLIDAWVKSGTDTEFKGTLFLIAGQSYPLRLEFSKAKQGVDDSAKNPNPPPKKASIELLWKLPNRTAEVIPARHLSPVRTPEVAVIETPFPPDDRSMGWERGTAVSKEWDQATTEAATEAAGYVIEKISELAGVADGAKDRKDRLRDFARRFAERAFRRPLSPEEKQLFIDKQFEAAADPDLALKRVLLLVLKSPRFLYLDVGNTPGPYATASRLSFALWDAPPDRELLEAASAGKIATRDEIARQAERMMADPRARVKIRDFLMTWLKVDQPRELVKDASRFPGFDAAIASDLRTSLELFIDDVVWSDGSDFRKLLLADDLYLNGRLAKYYGLELPAEAPYQKMKLDPEHRAGILTHPYLLATFAYNAESSPIHRGVFIGRSLLGIPIKPPQDAFTPLAPELHPSLTTRERVALQTRAAACNTCHGIMNPLGFALESFDATGRYRVKEKDRPVDVSGSYDTRAGSRVSFKGARELGVFLAGSDEVYTAFITHLFQHLAKQPVRAYGSSRPEELRKSFAENGFSIRKLVVDIAVTAAMTRRDQPPTR
jgi:cytochrome c553